MLATDQPAPIRLLVLFQGMWEDEALTKLEQAGRVVVFREGFELLSLAGLVRTTWFDAVRFAARLARRYRGRVDAVWSNDEQFGCLLAAIVARELDLPGADPAAIVRAQHKLLLRATLSEACPELSVHATALPAPLSDRRLREPAWIASAVQVQGRSWPLFCKPIKATFSVLARRVTHAEELACHLRLPWFDRVLLRRATLPFEQLARSCSRLPCGADHALLEEPIEGEQVNVDGYVCHGEVRRIGIVDEWMYPAEVAGARHFAGFTYPSRHAPAVQARLWEAAAAAIRAVGYDHGMFNVELFVLRDGRVKVIEVNPRSAGQFATMYQAVDGVDLEHTAITLAAGGDPAHAPCHPPTAKVAASFVFRRFDGGPGPVPTPAARAWLAATHPSARLWLESSSPTILRREYRWLGSHRHAVLNVAAGNLADLRALGDECGQRLFGCNVLPEA